MCEMRRKQAETQGAFTPNRLQEEASKGVSGLPRKEFSWVRCCQEATGKKMGTEMSRALSHSTAVADPRRYSFRGVGSGSGSWITGGPRGKGKEEVERAGGPHTFQELSLSSKGWRETGAANGMQISCPSGTLAICQRDGP